MQTSRFGNQPETEESIEYTAPPEPKR
jgi:hypothetical protein